MNIKQPNFYFGKLVLLFLILISLTLQARSQQDDYWNLDVKQRAEGFGFGYEDYRVTTQDGYILTLMRIPSGPNSPPQEGKEPILMSHPSFEAGEVFTRLGGTDSPAFYLADHDKDVWMYNVRGNTYSR